MQLTCSEYSDGKVVLRKEEYEHSSRWLGSINCTEAASVDSNSLTFQREMIMVFCPVDVAGNGKMHIHISPMKIIVERKERFEQALKTYPEASRFFRSGEYNVPLTG